MDSLKRLKMFPDRWYRKMTTRELEESRQQLKGYTQNTTLDMGIKEVFTLIFPSWVLLRQLLLERFRFL